MPIASWCFMMSAASSCFVLKSFLQRVCLLSCTVRCRLSTKRAGTNGIHQRSMFPIAQATINSYLRVGRFAHIAAVLMTNPHAFITLFYPSLSSISNPVSVCLGNDWETSFATWSITALAFQLESLIKWCIA